MSNENIKYNRSMEEFTYYIVFVIFCGNNIVKKSMEINYILEIDNYWVSLLQFKMKILDY